MHAANESGSREPSKRLVDAAIIVRPWPKVIFLYPTFIAALVAGVWQLWLKPESPARETVGLVFFLVFCANLMVISFEFTRVKTVAIFFLLLAVTFFILFLSDYFDVLSGFKKMFGGLHLTASTTMYFALAAYLAVVYIGVFIMTRWNYWEIRHNEIIHHTGFLGDIKRFPSPSLRMTKIINDVFEFLLLGSGRIVLYPASEREAVVLENVLNVNRAEQSIKRLLSAIKVELSSDRDYHDVDEH